MLLAFHSPSNFFVVGGGGGGVFFGKVFPFSQKDFLEQHALDLTPPGYPIPSSGEQHAWDLVHLVVST